MTERDFTGFDSRSSLYWRGPIYTFEALALAEKSTWLPAFGRCWDFFPLSFLESMKTRTQVHVVCQLSSEWIPAAELYLAQIAVLYWCLTWEFLISWEVISASNLFLISYPGFLEYLGREQETDLLNYQ